MDVDWEPGGRPETHILRLNCGVRAAPIFLLAVLRNCRYFPVSTSRMLVIQRVQSVVATDLATDSFLLAGGGVHYVSNPLSVPG